MSKNIDVLSLGSIYLDINSLRFPIDQGLLPETETMGGEYRVELGGSAVISARVGAKLGLKTAFIGKVGQDFFGDTVHELLIKNQVEPLLIKDIQAQTNLGLNFVGENGKTIMAAVGTANHQLTKDEVFTELEKTLPHVKYLYLGGYFKLKFLQTAYPNIIELAHQHQCQVVLDHGRINNQVSPSDIAALTHLISGVDIYLPSKDEFLTTWSAQTLDQGIQNLYQAGFKGVVAIKQASDGVTASINKTQPQHQPIFKVKTINTVGAGDSFNAGFIKGMSLGLPLDQVLKIAAATAALKISSLELPSFPDVQKMIESS